MGRFNQHTTGEEVVKACSPAADGKTIVITGPSEKSIGGATVLALAHAKPKRIVLCGRNSKRIQPVIDEYTKLNSNTQIDFVQVDMGDQDSVRKAAAEIAGLTNVVDVLFDNAGIMACPYAKTPQGIESQFGVNHIGHFLLTNLLMPQLKRAKQAKVVLTSSTGCNLPGVSFDDPNWNDGADYNPWIAYATSKSANALFAVSLASKFKEDGISAFAIQPGMPMTDLYAHVTETGPTSFAAAMELNAQRENPEDTTLDEKTLESACSTLLAAAFDPDLQRYSGGYLRNCDIYQVEKHASDPALAEKVWSMSEKLVGQTF